MAPRPVYKYPNARVKASSAQRDWPGLLAELLVHPAGRVEPLVTAMTELTVVLQGRGSVCRHLEGAPPQTIEAAPGDMWLTPAGVREHFIQFESAIPQALHVYFAGDCLESMCPPSWRCSTAIAGLRRDAPFGDTLVEEIARAVSADLQAPSAQSAFLTSTLCRCIAARLLHDHSELQKTNPGQSPSGLNARRLATVTAHIAEHLDRRLSVPELAEVACLSPSRFAHAFKTSTGETPEQYVRARRLERARTLLSDSSLSLAEVACVCGFSSQANFNKAFVRITSQPPGRYRRARSAEKRRPQPGSILEAS